MAEPHHGARHAHRPPDEGGRGHLGLREGMLVVQGGSDAFIGVIGLGVTKPGEMALITGSSHLHIGIADRVVHKPGVWGTYMDGVYPGKPIIEGGQTSTGSVIAWFKRHFAEHTSWETLNAGAAAVPPGAEGLLVLDHFQGNRTPYTDALSRGAITGLTLKHTPAMCSAPSSKASASAPG
jgi:ribulose kinase